MRRMFLAVLGVLLLCTTSGAALFDGKVVSYQYFYPSLNEPYGAAANGSYTVGPGVEIPNISDGRGTMDISDTNLFINFTVQADASFNPGFFNGFRIQDVNNSIADFTSVSINLITNMSGFDASKIIFDANNIWVNWQSLVFNSQTIVSLDINEKSEPVPEPATMLLLGCGLIGLVGSRRKFKK